MPLKEISSLPTTHTTVSQSSFWTSSRPRTPIYTQPDPTSDSSSESDGNESDPEATATVYRGYRGPRNLQTAVMALSPYARELVSRGMSPEDALKQARKAARSICLDAESKRESVLAHSINSSARVFPIADEPGGRGLSPFVSTTDKHKTAQNFAKRLPSHSVEPDASSSYMTVKVKRSKLIRNANNPYEGELLSKGGINPRHISRFTRVLD